MFQLAKLFRETQPCRPNAEMSLKYIRSDDFIWPALVAVPCNCSIRSTIQFNSLMQCSSAPRPSLHHPLGGQNILFRYPGFYRSTVSFRFTVSSACMSSPPLMTSSGTSCVASVSRIGFCRQSCTFKWSTIDAEERRRSGLVNGGVSQIPPRMLVPRKQ